MQAREHGIRVSLVARPPQVVFTAALAALEGAGYERREVDRRERLATFTCHGGDELGGHTFRLEVSGLDPETGAHSAALLTVGFTTSDGAPPDRAARREGRAIARRVVAETAAVLDSTEPGAAELALQQRGRPLRRPLHRLVGDRAGLAAVVLLVAYLLPLGVVWGVLQAVEAGLLGSTLWWPLTLAALLGPCAVVGLTVWFGGWFQMIDFGEEYMLTFPFLRGFALGWWRLALQLGSFVLTALLMADVEDAATLNRITDAASEALPTYAERAPVPAGGEPLGDPELDQNVYAEAPNATYHRDYVVPASYDLTDAEAWLRDPAWAAGVEGEAPIGELRAIACDRGTTRCEAEVAPPDGEPVEYRVGLSLDEEGFTTQRDGEMVDIGVLRTEIEYQRATP